MIRRGVLALLCGCAILAAQQNMREFEKALDAQETVRVHDLVDAALRGDSGTEALLKLGVLLAGREAYSEAGRVFAQCVRNDPASFECGYNLALARLALQDSQGALLALKALTANGVEQKAAVGYLRGKILLTAGQERDGVESMAAAFRANPSDENCALDLGLALIRARAYSPAMETLREASRIHPDSRLLLLEMSLAEALGGEYEDAVAHSRKLLQDDPANTLPALVEAFSLYAGGRYAECVHTAAAALESPTANPYFHYLRAGASWKMNSPDYVSMSRDLAEAERRMPDCGVCLLLHSKVHEKMNEDNAAVAELESALRADPRLAPAWYRLAQLYRKQGKPADAAKALARYQVIRSTEGEHDREFFRRQAIGAFDSTPGP
ncbi:MAG TPA: tetratricopeptide repeat protein [Bryobacteraceae bacterium]|nr:tetratricopeptide repeat protein [Bryobacteraceae bacterium]